MAKDRLPEPTTFAKELPGGQFVLVVLGDPDADQRAVANATEQAQLDTIRKTYPRSGLYHRDRAEMLWPIEGYSPSDCLFISSDGVSMARLEGDWWQTKEYPSPSRLPADVEAAQLQLPAVGFYRNGEKIRTYRITDLLTNPRDIKHSPLHLLWSAGAVLNEETGRFVLHLQDSGRAVFDYRTGELVRQDRVGLRNPLFRWIAGGVGLSVVLILAVWGFLVWRQST